MDILELPSISKDTHLFEEISIPLLSVRKFCARNLGVLFYGDKATVFQPSGSTVELDGKPILTGLLDKETELYMVNVNSIAPATFPQGNTHIHNINTENTR